MQICCLFHFKPWQTDLKGTLGSTAALEEKPTMYLDEMCHFLWGEYDVWLSSSAVRRALVKAKWSKKTILHIHILNDLVDDVGPTAYDREELGAQNGLGPSFEWMGCCTARICP